MLVYYFLQEDKLWKKKDVLHKFAFLLHNLCCFSLSLLFSFALMPTMPKSQGKLNDTKKDLKEDKISFISNFLCKFS